MTEANLAPSAPRHAACSSHDFLAGSIRLRKAGWHDLAQINSLIEAAMGTWRLAERVKRLSLPMYQYCKQDLEHLQVIVAETRGFDVVGVAAIEAADASDCPYGHSAALLHGIYVDPSRHRAGIGACLLEHVQQVASLNNFDGMLVRANPEATPFFEARDFKKLPVENPERDYHYRFWRTF